MAETEVEHAARRARERAAFAKLRKLEDGGYAIASATEPTFGLHVGGVVFRNVHPESKCAGQACVIHNPSDHHMRDWPLTWRGDKGVFERHCQDGIGHPDPDDASYLHRVGKDVWTVHGCDGCCHE